MSAFAKIRSFAQRFARDESGVVTLEFALVFPIFFGMFLMIFESGMISLRHVMLERGVDVAVRDVRIGRMPNPTRAQLRARICEVAQIIPDCLTQLDLEMVRRDPSAWVPINVKAKCVNRGTVNQDDTPIDATANNQLMVLRVCARIDPFLPTSVLGKAIVEASPQASAGGSLALISTAAFVVEPFRAEE